jgi:hypothetical protein
MEWIESLALIGGACEQCTLVDPLCLPQEIPLWKLTLSYIGEGEAAQGMHAEPRRQASGPRWPHFSPSYFSPLGG